MKLLTPVISSLSGIQYYKVKLATPLKADDKVTLIVKASYAKRIEAFPKEISQVGKQMYVYRDNVHFYSPYQSEKQKTTVKYVHHHRPRVGRRRHSRR